MQSTWYSVIASKDGTHWIELTPRPRSRSRAFMRYEEVVAAGDYGYVRLERHCAKRDVLKRTPRTGTITPAVTAQSC